MTSEQKWDLVQHRVENAQKTLFEVDILVRNNLFNIAVNRVYYACYYAVSALLLYYNIKSRTHSGNIQMFGLHFINNGLITEASGDFYTKLYTMRHKGDYEDFIEYQEADVLVLLNPAKQLIDRITEILDTQRATDHTS